MDMRPYVTYTTYAKSSKEQTGDIITFVQVEEGNISTKTCNDTESGDKSDYDSIMPPLLIKEEMDANDSGDESDHDLISTEMLEDICDGSQSHPNVNQIEACYKIRDRIRQRQSERKGALKDTQNMSKCLHKVFKTSVKYISQYLPPLIESGSKVSYFIPEPRKFAEVTKFSDDIKKPWLKETLKEIKNLINNQNFLVGYPEKDTPVTPCMDVYKANIKYSLSLIPVTVPR